jgi:hypothetical protein
VSLAVAALKALSGARAEKGWTVATAAAGTAAAGTAARGAARAVRAPSVARRPVLFMRTFQVEAPAKITSGYVVLLAQQQVIDAPFPGETRSANRDARTALYRVTTIVAMSRGGCRRSWNFRSVDHRNLLTGDAVGASLLGDRGSHRRRDP